MNTTIETFVNKVSSILEHDDIDFMRISSMYLFELRRDLPVLEDKNIEKKISEMQDYLQIKSSWSVEIAKKNIFQDAHYIDELLQSHQQDWESPPPIEE